MPLGFQSNKTPLPLVDHPVCACVVQCYSGCLQNERWTKPGECPVGDLDGSGVASLDRPCLEQCSSDDFCRAEYKCCRHSCGITCQPPVRLADSPGTGRLTPSVFVVFALRTTTVLFYLHAIFVLRRFTSHNVDAFGSIRRAGKGFLYLLTVSNVIFHYSRTGSRAY